ncbi:hypothetical protein [Methanobrevibacter sp. DSM 116169]|uniref:hypothetical protein n=1 Tax=Methanobrevibacter sp. DSM 116169 TaxID=3242727 RepID=UPI0038FC47F3
MISPKENYEIFMDNLMYLYDFRKTHDEIIIKIQDIDNYISKFHKTFNNTWEEIKEDFNIVLHNESPKDPITGDTININKEIKNNIIKLAENITLNLKNTYEFAKKDISSDNDILLDDHLRDIISINNLIVDIREDLNSFNKYDFDFKLNQLKSLN